MLIAKIRNESFFMEGQVDGYTKIKNIKTTFSFLFPIQEKVV